MKKDDKKERVDPGDQPPGAYPLFSRPLGLRRNTNQQRQQRIQVTQDENGNNHIPPELRTNAPPETTPIQASVSPDINREPEESLSEPKAVSSRVVQQLVDRLDTVLDKQVQQRVARDIPSAEVVEPDEFSLRKKRRTLLCLVIAGIILIAMGAGITASFTVRPCSEKEPQIVDGSETEQPTTTSEIDAVPPTLAPSMVPPAPEPNPSTLAPTDAPTSTAPSSAPTSTIQPTSSDRLTAVKDILYEISGDLLDDETTFQYQALSWLVFEDFRQVPVHPNTRMELIQRYIMALLYLSTDGPNWKYQAEFLSFRSVCEWNGVTAEFYEIGAFCDTNGRINEIFLGKSTTWVYFFTDTNKTTHTLMLNVFYTDDNNLLGPIPHEVAALSHLVRLVIFDNLLSGTLPDLSRLSNLEELYVYFNDLEGTLPTTRGNLKSINTLDLSWNGFSGFVPSEIGNLSNLQYLYLENNELGGTIPSSLGNLSDLGKLSVYRNQVIYKSMLTNILRHSENW